MIHLTWDLEGYKETNVRPICQTSFNPFLIDLFGLPFPSCGLEIIVRSVTALVEFLKVLKSLRECYILLQKRQDWQKCLVNC